MSARDRRAKIERAGAGVSVRRQCALLNVARSGVYRPQPEPDAQDLVLMRRLDEIYLEKPFYGSRRMTFVLNEEGRGVNRKRVQRLMRLMGLEALVPRPGTSKAAPGNKIYPYLLRGLTITEPNHVWASDITYIPMAHGFLYLVAVIDWASRAVLAWRLSNTMDSGFCVEALEEAQQRHGKASTGSAANIQHRPGCAIHQFGLHRQAGGGRNRDLDGRARPVHGQHLHRASVAFDQIRRGPSESLRRRPRSTGGHRPMD